MGLITTIIIINIFDGTEKKKIYPSSCQSRMGFNNTENVTILITNCANNYDIHWTNQFTGRHVCNGREDDGPWRSITGEGLAPSYL